MSIKQGGIIEQLPVRVARGVLVMTLGASSVIGAIEINALPADALPAIGGYKDDLTTGGDCTATTSPEGTSTTKSVFSIEIGMAGYLNATKGTIDDVGNNLTITAVDTDPDPATGEPLPMGKPINNSTITPAGKYEVKDLPPELAVYTATFHDIEGGDYNSSTGINCSAATTTETTPSTITVSPPSTFIIAPPTSALSTPSTLPEAIRTPQANTRENLEPKGAPSPAKSETAAQRPSPIKTSTALQNGEKYAPQQATQTDATLAAVIDKHPDSAQETVTSTLVEAPNESGKSIWSSPEDGAASLIEASPHHSGNNRAPSKPGMLLLLSGVGGIGLSGARAITKRKKG